MSAPKSESKNVHSVTIDGQWLDNDELYVCAVQPPTPSLESLRNDAPRSDARDLAKALLSKNSKETCRLAKWSRKKPALLIFGELAFGSEDFDELDSLIKGYDHDLIVLAGFGFCPGGRLQKIIHDRPLETAWPDREVDTDGTYNGGWCWVHRPGEQPDNRPRAIVFLKNFAEQKVELPLIDDWTRGTHILRLDSEDLTIFPLICADLLEEDPWGARARIRRVLADENTAVDGKPKNTRKKLVAGLLLDKNPHHDLWKVALNELVRAETQPRVAVFLVNQYFPYPHKDEKQDAWRSLTGAFVGKGQMSDPPANSLKHVRCVSSDSSQGLVLRLTEECGVAAGPLRWSFGATQGRYSWSPNRRFVWCQGKLVPEKNTVEARELSRFLLRHQQPVLDLAHKDWESTLRSRVSKTHQSILDHKTKWIQRLWPNLLSGPKDDGSRSEPLNAELLHKFADSLERALRLLVLLNTDEISPSELSEAQWQLSDNRWLTIWCDPEYSLWKQKKLLQKLALDAGKPLVVIGTGQGGWNSLERIVPSEQSSSPEQIVPHPRTDITQPPLGFEERRVDSGRSFRQIWWLPLGIFENLVAQDPSDSKEPIEEAQLAQALDERLHQEIDTLIEQIQGTAK